MPGCFANSASRFFVSSSASAWQAFRQGGAALDSPLKVDITDVSAQAPGAASAAPRQSNTAPNGSQDLYAAALRAGAAGQVDQNGQASKEDFFNADIKDLGYLPNQVVPQQSRYELKRGSVIPATLITGINSDLPGRITAQVSQNVYDSATGHFMLVPQGTKLFGRYDSKVSFGQNRALVVWSDIIFPNGSTLQIGGMAGTDSEGYGGFSDKVDNHYLRTFGSAALVALIGTGIDMSMPQSSNSCHARHGLRRRPQEFCRDILACCGTDHFEESQRPTDNQDPTRFPVQCPGRPGHHFSGELQQLRYEHDGG